MKGPLAELKKAGDSVTLHVGGREVRLSLEKAADLAEYPANPRKNEVTDDLVRAFEEFGFLDPVIVNGRNGQLVAGHRRLRAAAEKGTVLVPALWTDLDEEGHARLNLYHNRSSELGGDDGDPWDREALAGQLQALEDLAGSGFDEEALQELCDSLEIEEPTPLEDPGPSEPPAEPVTKTGDVWVCGEHRVVCGDCTEAGVWTQHCDLLLADPPYNVGIDYGEATDDEQAIEAYAEWTRLWFGLAQGHTERQIVTTGRQNIALWEDLTALAWGCWTKRNAHSGASIAHFGKWEPIAFVGKHGRKRDSDVFEYDVGTGFLKIPEIDAHACPKPLALWTDLLQHYCEETVADPFLGSGTTLVAAEQLGRRCFGIEVEPRYVDVCCLRFHKMSGNPVVHAETGDEFPFPEQDDA